MFPLKLFLLVTIHSTFGVLWHPKNQVLSNPQYTSSEKTRLISMLLSSLQCFSESDPNAKLLLHIQKTFNPHDYLYSYHNQTDVLNLLSLVQNSTNIPTDFPFTNAPSDLNNMKIILNVLFLNTENFQLFYNTSVWLVGKVNSGALYWSLTATILDKYPEVITPSAVEVFPQFYINKWDILEAANLANGQYEENEYPLKYFMSDPGLNEFHFRWHAINPFWWDTVKYGVHRRLRGELFLYMHHQIVNRYEAELIANNISGYSQLELDPNYIIPEGYVPDIVNINYQDYFSRKPNDKLANWDNPDEAQINTLKTWYERLVAGIDQGYLLKADGSHQSLLYANGTDDLGRATQPDAILSANLNYYGQFHNRLHRVLAGEVLYVWPGNGLPGIQSHPESSVRDPVFWRLHKLVDSIYTRFTGKKRPYTKTELNFPGIEIKSVEIYSPENIHGQYGYQASSILTTYFDSVIYDISTAARPCRGINDEAVPAPVKILNHYPFHYKIRVKSTRNQVAYGMVRIFLLPEYTLNGTKFDVESSHSRAIELDRFAVKLDGEETVIKRASWESTVTNSGKQPGLKRLFEINELEENELKKSKVICGYPENLLIPKGTSLGLRYKLNVMISEEEKLEEGVDEMEEKLEKEGVDEMSYPYCGVLHGLKFPDKREMGFPFDRLGTRFHDGVADGLTYKNVKEVRVIIRHLDVHSKLS